MVTPTVVALVVFAVVVVAMIIRDGTKHTPESRLRLWATRVAVAVIITWYAGSLLYTVHTRHSMHLLLSRWFLRTIVAIALVWVVFRDDI